MKLSRLIAAFVLWTLIAVLYVFSTIIIINHAHSQNPLNWVGVVVGYPLLGFYWRELMALLNSRLDCQLSGEFVHWYLVLGWPLSFLLLLVFLIGGGFLIAGLCALAFLAEMASTVADALTSCWQN